MCFCPATRPGITSISQSWMVARCARAKRWMLAWAKRMSSFSVSGTCRAAAAMASGETTTGPSQPSISCARARTAASPSASIRASSASTPARTSVCPDSGVRVAFFR
jgi:hypothetical protein